MVLTFDTRITDYTTWKRYFSIRLFIQNEHTALQYVWCFYSGLAFEWTFDSNDVPERTGLVSVRSNCHQPYVALNTAQARGVVDKPAVIPAVNDL